MATYQDERGGYGCLVILVMAVVFWGMVYGAWIYLHDNTPQDTHNEQSADPG